MVNVQVEDIKQPEISEMNHFDILAFYRHRTKDEIKAWKDKIDFNDLEYAVEERRKQIVHTCLNRFQDQYISVMIADYARNLFDGIWRTSNRVVCYELENQDLVGYFNGYLLLGKVFGDEVIWHQYSSAKQTMTVYFKIDVTHNKLDGHYFTGEHAKMDQPASLEMYRADVPYFMAMKAVQHGDIPRLRQLHSKFRFDFNQALPEANNFTVLHNAVSYNQEGVVRYLLEKEGRVDLQARNSLEQNAFDLAASLNLTNIMECFPTDFMDEYERMSQK